MKNQFDKLSLAQSITHRGMLGKFGIGFVLACFGLMQTVVAQTTLVCDSTGDAAMANGKANGSPVPLWLDINEAVVSAASSGDILFTLSLNAPVPTVPSWSKIEEGGQVTWGWRLIGKLADLTFVQNGCIGPNGAVLPASYYLDLIWSVGSSTFEARLLDNTACAQATIPFAFSLDRTQITMLVPPSLLANRFLIPDPDNFELLAVTVLWSANAMSNNSYHSLDWAPDRTEGPIESCVWSSWRNTVCSCP